MGKGIGLIGNFRGKVGNMVGYNLKDSNNKQTQGVRVYQPVVKNPKSYGQAEQRAKLMPINATYRLIKPIIDRGQETKAYGNKSRLAWLKSALKNYNGMWVARGEQMKNIPLLPITQGSLNNPLSADTGSGEVQIRIEGLEAAETPVLGTVATAILAKFPTLKAGDQVTIIAFGVINGKAAVKYDSFVLDTGSAETMDANFKASANHLDFQTPDFDAIATCIVISREGSAGQHLRSTSSVVATAEYPTSREISESKEPAIRSYMAGGVNSDWPEESIQ